MAKKPNSSSDDQLGMDRDITRRDFLSGVGVTIGAFGLSGCQLPGVVAESQTVRPDYYPPALTGLRGSHSGSFELAHLLLDGAQWQAQEAAQNYDLIVVGGGLSGLAAAYHYRKRFGENSRILVLENHDDFGGHAKRNEFLVDGKLLIGYGGTQSIEAPGSYPAVAKALLRDLGVDVNRFYSAYDRQFNATHNLQTGTFFSRAQYGRSSTVAGNRHSLSDAYLSKTLLSTSARQQLAKLRDYNENPFGSMSAEGQMRRLESMSYREYLQANVGLGPEALRFMQYWSSSLWAIGIDGLPALAAWSSSYPGLAGIELPLSAYRTDDDEPYIFHFPDGNASLARLLVRALVPAVAPGQSMEDIVTARFDYSQLDVPTSKVRIRLNSTVLRVTSDGEGDGPVNVVYGTNGRTEAARARHCVLACYHSIIPYLCPDLPGAQKAALASSQRAPLVYTNVAVRNWRAFKQLGVHRIYCPGQFHNNVSLDFPVSLGGYQFADSPDDPTVLHLTRIPGAEGLSPRQQFQAGKKELLSMSFDTFERETRRQLAEVLGEGGFDPATDIAGITVNRWPHGYAYGYDPTSDRIAFEYGHWPAAKRIWQQASAPFGNITFANTDAAANAMTESAIEEAYRAIQELT